MMSTLKHHAPIISAVASMIFILVMLGSFMWSIVQFSVNPLEADIRETQQAIGELREDLIEAMAKNHAETLSLLASHEHDGEGNVKVALDDGGR